MNAKALKRLRRIARGAIKGNETCAALLVKYDLKDARRALDVAARSSSLRRYFVRQQAAETTEGTA